MDFKDYYATLGVTKTASDKDIKQAFRKLARKYHPDVNPGDKAAEARFKEINEANEVLSDPDKRRKYDELGANWRMYEHAQPRGGPSSSGAGSGAGFRSMTPEEMDAIFGGGGGDSTFSDFFTTFFGVFFLTFYFYVNTHCIGKSLYGSFKCAFHFWVGIATYFYSFTSF